MKPLSHDLATQVHAGYHLANIPQAIEELIFNSMYLFPLLLSQSIFQALTQAAV